GPGGNFLMEDSTLKAVRSDEWYLPHLGVHDSYENWLGNGSPMLEEQAREEVTRILASHHPEPLEGEMEKEVSRMHTAAKKVKGRFPLV
ncbi:MAG: trimethylamine methyltransferase family protein, partial [Deltaproteobacteria bacterium]